jgi:hypothetical protein
VNPIDVVFGQWLRCARCGRMRARMDINTEAVIHHKANELLCKDRKECKRAARKASKRKAQ